MADNKATALKEANTVYTDGVEYKMYLVLGESPSHKSRVIDITESIPDDLVEEYYASDLRDAESDSRKYSGISASVIGVMETIESPDISDGLELPLCNPFGIFVSIQQKINTALQAAIVNERKLNALTSMIDNIFKQCEYERELGLKHCLKKEM